MPSNPTEREVKLAVDRHFAVPDLRDLVKRTVRLPEQRLVAVYFDTPDHRLWARQITLRHRIGEHGDRGTWTLKAPRSNSGQALDRTEMEWPGPLDCVPVQVGGILSGIVRREPLQRITSLETVRRRLVLQGSSEIPLVELDDDSVNIQGGPRDGGSFRQIELEVAEADDELLAACVDRMCDAGARIDDRGPKLARAIDDDGAGGVVTPSPGANSTMADVVQASIRAGFNRILDHEYLLRWEPEDAPPEAIHQTRVAARRLRSDLQTFKPLLDPVWVRHVRSDLKWLGEVLGLVRDVDVLAQDLDLSGPPSAGMKGVAGLREQLHHERTLGAERVALALQSERYLVLLDKLHAATERPPFLEMGSSGRGFSPSRKASKALPKLVKRPWKKLRRRVQGAGEEPTDRELHKIRIRAKRLRYAAEAAEPVVGRKAKRVAASAEWLQTQLGEHHDAVVAEAWLRTMAKGGSTKAAFSAGLLAGEQIRRQRHYREEWRAGWEKGDRRARTWLG